MALKIYHNPRCSKSRETLALIQESGNDVEIVEYLKEIPSQDDLKLLLAKLNLKPQDIIRTTEAVYKEKFKGLNLNDEEWIMAMVEYPKLIQRPIVVKGNKAVIGRPPENVKELF